MTAEIRFLCSLANGLHARPASMLADAVRTLDAVVRLHKLGAAPVDARSVLSVVGLDVRLGDECVFTAEGAQADEAIRAARALVGGGWAKMEASHPAESRSVGARPTARNADLPLSLRDQKIEFATGIPACSGIGRGKAVLVSGLTLTPEMRDAKPKGVEHEVSAATNAMRAVAGAIRARAHAATQTLERDLLTAHAQIAEDPSLIEEVALHVRLGCTAAQAVVKSANHFMDQLRKAASEYVRDRVIDIQDVATQVVDELSGEGGKSKGVAMECEAIVFADSLTPSQLMQMDRTRLKGLVLGSVGATSHTVILARSLGIPTLLNVHDRAKVAAAGDAVVVDADRGVVLRAAIPAVQRYYDTAQRTRRRRRERLEPVARRAGATQDGISLEVAVNASTPTEVSVAVAQGAEGVGLLRTELLFLDRAAVPTEEEQYAAYCDVVEAAKGRSVIIRTLDIGGDKPAAYMTLPKEENPFLGYRGIRMYPQYVDLIRTQLRAILRASARGPVKVMAPMVSVVSEAAWFRDQVRDVARELEAEGIAVGRDVPVGVMVEVPSVSLAIDELSKIVDFFSIGTNDLCQYWMAVDRGNTAVGSLYNARQPSFLRLLASIIKRARECGRWIGVCGEMASDRRHLPLLVGMGVHEISVAPGEVLNLKATLATLDSPACRNLLDAALACGTPEEVDSVLAAGLAGASGGSAQAGVIELDAIVTSSDARSKHEAIREAVDALYVAGRTNQPDAVEEAAWAREHTYSTGLGYGFAIPHCKAEGITAASLAVVKLKQPVEWGSSDGQPVHIVLLLAVPASDTAGSHMKVFAKLARKLMHEEFRTRLNDAGNAKEILRTLQDELQL